MAPDIFWPIGLTLLLLFGAVSDIRARRLPNWLALLLFVFGMSHAYLTGGIDALPWHALHAGVALLVGMGLFAIGWFGGGDAKFYAGAAAYFPVASGVQMLLWVSVIGAVLILGWMMIRRLIGIKVKADDPKGLFPYGVAIAAGTSALAWSQTPLA